MAVTFKFKADGTGYTKGLEKMRGQTKKWSGSIGKMVAGAFAFGAVTSGLRSWVQGLNETAKAAKLLGTTAQEMEKLAFIAEKGKVEFDDLKEFISNVNERVFEGAIQAGHMAAEWEALGINADELKDKAPIDVMSRISDEFRSTGDQASFAAAGIALFGDDFKRVINVVEMGGDEINRLGEEASTTSDKTRNNIESATQAWISFKNMAVKSLAGIAEPLSSLGRLIVWTFASGIDVVITFFKVVGNLAGAFMSLGTVISRALRLDFRGAKQGLDDIKNRFSDIGNEVSGLAERVNTGLDLALEVKVKYSWNEEEIKHNEVINKIAENRVKIEKEIADIKKKAADAEETARFNALSTAEKLLEIEKEKKRLKNEIENREVDLMTSGISDEEKLSLNDRLAQNRKELAELEAKEGGVKRDQTKEEEKAFQDGIKKAAEEAKDFAEKIEELNKNISDLDIEKNQIIDQQAFDKMSDPEKLASLKAKKDKLNEDAKRAGERGDIKSQKELEIEALNLNPEIESLSDSFNTSSNPSIIASSLASIGGGGGVAAFGNDPAIAVQNKQLGVLERIEGHLNPASGLDSSRNLETPEL